jgi:hypothetical protein
VVTARAGVGKTACLVQLGLAELARGRSVLHVALDMPVHEVRGWYDRVASEAGRLGWLELDESRRLRLERERHIHSYRQQGFNADRLDEALSFLAEVMEFQPRAAVLDGFPFELARHDALAALREVARTHALPLWLTALSHRHEPPDEQTGLPRSLAPFSDLVDVVVGLTPDHHHIQLRLLRDHDHDATALPELSLELDPASLLIKDA